MATKGENSLGRLNEVLFEELERLGAMDVEQEDLLRIEMARAKAIQGVAREINESAKTVMDAARMRVEYAGAKAAQPPKLLEG